MGIYDNNRSQHEVNHEFRQLIGVTFTAAEAAVYDRIFESREGVTLVPVEDGQKIAAADSMDMDRAEAKLLGVIERLKGIGRDWFGDEHFPPGSFSA
jgi:hypothetical protein